MLPTLATLLLGLAVASAQLTGPEQSEMLVEHRNQRSSVSPGSNNMAALAWNTSMAARAQSLAAGCDYTANLPAAWSKYGKNVGARNSANQLSHTEVVRLWDAESANYNYDTNKCSTSGACNNYLQLVNAETTLVGCGRASCSNLANGPADTVAVPSDFYVCVYHPEYDFSKKPRPYKSPVPVGPPADAQCLGGLPCPGKYQQLKSGLQLFPL
eukprot:TRINITY_DN3145_c0_g1_i2.p1 TRINITY_DN3145_c0_g1~~TRINITY_DN3145_c0_g1_i2.p1  ORF type:complete len:223 (+),score=47.25 TRINITY_DN3145_c0_g1_i2:33-671(+)